MLVCVFNQTWKDDEHAWVGDKTCYLDLVDVVDGVVELDRLPSDTRALSLAHRWRRDQSARSGVCVGTWDVQCAVVAKQEAWHVESQQRCCYMLWTRSNCHRWRSCNTTLSWQVDSSTRSSKASDRESEHINIPKGRFSLRKSVSFAQHSADA